MQIPLHLYMCTSCVSVFGVEAHEDIDHSVIVCPICRQDWPIEGVADSVPVQFENEYREEEEADENR